MADGLLIAFVSILAQTVPTTTTTVTGTSVKKPVAVIVQSPTAPRAALPGIWAATWSSVPQGLPFVSPMVWVRDAQSGYDHFRDGGPVLADPALVAQKLAELPQGRRSLHLWHFRQGLLTDPRDHVPGLAANARSPWPTTASNIARQQWSGFLDGLAATGVAPNVVILDNEESGFLTNWHLGSADIGAIMRDARYASLGGGGGATSSTAPTGSSLQYASPQIGPGYLVWNKYIQSVPNAAFNEALWEPVHSRFPNARASNYQGMRINSNDAVGDFNGHEQPMDSRFGTASAPALYGVMEGLADHASIDPLDKTHVKFGGAIPLGRSPWLSFLMDVQMARAVRRADAAPMHPWIASPSWQGDKVGTAGYPADKRYYDEMIRHVALLGAETFMLWNPPITVNNIDNADAQAKRFDEARKLDTVLSQVNHRLGGNLAQSTGAPRIAWDAQCIASGAKLADGSFLWRITAPAQVRSLYLGVNGRIITIPDGQVGVWLTTAKATPPLIKPVTPQKPATNSDGQLTAVTTPN